MYRVFLSREYLNYDIENYSCTQMCSEEQIEKEEE